MRTDARARPLPAQVAATAAEVVVALALATGAVALLERVAPITGLGVLYLLAVLLLAIRRGEIAALATALLSVLVLNYFFIEPRHRLTIAESENVVSLGVFLIAAVVVGRLAAAARDRAAEADARARVATAREREAALLAEAASSIVARPNLDAQLAAVGAAVAHAAGAEDARVQIGAVPASEPGEVSVRLPLGVRPGWLHLRGESAWSREDLERLAPPLARVVDVALERQRLDAVAADQEAARRADVAKTAVLHAISHDLRSPLTAITTAVGGLRAPGVTDADRAELEDVLADEAERLSNLVDDLLDLSRIEAGAVDPRPDWCDLRDVVASAAGQARSLAGEHPVELALPADLPLVRADSVQLERVFANLLSNAIRFSPPEDPVRVTGGFGGGWVTVRVTDRGRGIPAAQRQRIFEPFYRGRASGPGSGLGLAICRGFVQANGGRIVVQQPTGEGTSFAVSLPLVPQPALSP